MKILHCCLSCFYIDEFSYQENLLPKFNLKHGHVVEIIASTEIFMPDGQLGYIQPSEYKTEDGIKITRVPYARWLPFAIMKKIRSYKGVYLLIEKFQPDVIMFHGLAAFELLNVVKYIKNHPNVKLYVDSHEDYNNSGRNYISRHILHEIVYRSVIKKSMPYINRVFYLTEEVKDFILNEYKIPTEKMEYYPLGGVVISKEEKEEFRKQVQLEHNIHDGRLLIVHSGKLDELKRTDILLETVDKFPSGKVLLLIAGTIPQENKGLREKIQAGKNVRWLGWLDAEGMKKYLCAADVYAQPGSQSATAQNAICCGTPVFLYPHKSYQALCNGNVMWTKDAEDILQAIEKVLDSPTLLNRLSEASFELATSLLDYNALAAKIEK